MAGQNVRHETNGSVTRLSPDFVLELSSEKIAGAGEDAYCYVVGEDASVAAVFDGCGGSGARRYEHVQGKTGAFLASRVVSAAVHDWFAAGEAVGEPAEASTLLRERMKRYLDICREASGGVSRIRGRMAKELPTTCATAVLREGPEGTEALCLWAGDSRVYLLDANGLHQLTTDDLGGIDAFENLSADGVMTNVVSAAEAFELHVRRVPLAGPCLLFAATDGCFGYLSTPMEFEHLLLRSLGEAASPADWEAHLYRQVAAVAADDATLCGLSVGYGSFGALQTALAARAAELHQSYIEPSLGQGIEVRRALWERYRVGYECWM